MSPTKSFILPEDKDVDIIMVGPGTGIAPFRAFMEQRVFDGGKGRNWLFFGDQSSKTEFYYKEQIEGWMDSGDLYRFTTAWSRDQAEKIYVQHRLKEHGEEIWQWFENGAYFYSRPSYVSEWSPQRSLVWFGSVSLSVRSVSR